MIVTQTVVLRRNQAVSLDIIQIVIEIHLLVGQAITVIVDPTMTPTAKEQTRTWTELPSSVRQKFSAMTRTTSLQEFGEPQNRNKILMVLAQIEPQAKTVLMTTKEAAACHRNPSLPWRSILSTNVGIRLPHKNRIFNTTRQKSTPSPQK